MVPLSVVAAALNVHTRKVQLLVNDGTGGGLATRVIVRVVVADAPPLSVAVSVTV